MLNEKNCLQTPNNQTNLAEYLVSEYIDEIRSTTSAGTLVPVSPEANPNEMHQNIPNIPPMTSFKNMKDSSKKLSDSIIQISKPTRSIDVFGKEYEVQRGKGSLVAYNCVNRSGSATNRNKSPSISSVSKNSNIGNKLNVSTVSSSTPKLKNKVHMRTISKKCIKKLNTKAILNNSKVNPNSEKLTNGNRDINLTVCFAANSSTRIVSNSSKNLGTVSNNLQKSKLKTKKLSQDPSVAKACVTTKNNLNKSNIILNKTTNKLSSKKSATNINSNLLVKIPVSNLNVSKTEQAQKEPFIVSINKAAKEKITTVTSNISQCNVSEPAIQRRTINLKCQDSGSNNNSLQCRISKPLFKSINSTGHQDKQSIVIASTKKCINRDMNYQEDNKTKVQITPTSIPSSHAKDSLVSCPQKDHVDIKTVKLTQQKLDINKIEASKSFSGKDCFF